MWTAKDIEKEEKLQEKVYCKTIEKKKYHVYNGKCKALEHLNIPLTKMNTANRKKVKTLNIKTFCLVGNEI